MGVGMLDVWSNDLENVLLRRGFVWKMLKIGIVNRSNPFWLDFKTQFRNNGTIWEGNSFHINSLIWTHHHYHQAPSDFELKRSLDLVFRKKQFSTTGTPHPRHRPLDDVRDKNLIVFYNCCGKFTASEKSHLWVVHPFFLHPSCTKLTTSWCREPDCMG